jgi:hypothetical protein
MMKNFRKIVHASLLALGLYLNFDAAAQQPIASNFFGQNAWMPDTIGSAVLGGKLHQTWGAIAESKASIIRFGGITADDNKPTNYQYIKMIDSIRAKGMEPVIQVPYHKGKYTAQQAADIVKYVNVTKGKNVKYWIIGNEPDLEYQYTTAAQVANYFKPFSSAMKAADPNIAIVGPETAWFNQAIIDGLTTPGGPNDITGRDQSGRLYLDVISFHTYPFSGAQSRSDVVNYLNGANGLNEKLVYLNQRVAAANTAHNRTGNAALKTAVTEMNINYKNNANDNVYGTGVNSFVGAQFIAEMFAVGLKNNVSFMNIWSVVEGNTQELNIGYLDRTTLQKKPAFYHFKMMAENFKGTFIQGTSSMPNVKVFGSQSTQNIQVMIMNQDQGGNHNYTVRLNGSAIAGNSALKMNVNANLNIEYNGVIQNQSTILLTFNPAGVLIKKTEYTITQASAGQAPQVTEFNGGVGGVVNGVVTSAEDGGEAVSMKGFTMNIFPNPARSKFTIQLDRPNKLEVKFVVEVYDLMGRLIYTQNSVFPEREQKIDLSGQSVAEAVYIVRVREEADKDNWRATKVIVFK